MPREKKPKSKAKFDDPDPFEIPSGVKGNQEIIEYDEDLIRELASHGCTIYEIAHICGFSESHFHELKKRYPGIQQAIDEGKANLHKSLRKKQVEVALDGNPQMLIFLGKAELGQTDRVEINQNVKAEVEYEIKFGEPIKADEEDDQAPETTSSST
jgi:hypothetical protein